jgi:hypothetical protein
LLVVLFDQRPSGVNANALIFMVVGLLAEWLAEEVHM